jgi:hypothetical protein
MTEEEFVRWAAAHALPIDQLVRSAADAGVKPAALLLLVIGTMADAYPTASLPEVLSEVGIELFNAIKASGIEDPFLQRVEEAKAKIKAYEEAKGEA